MPGNVLSAIIICAGVTLQAARPRSASALRLSSSVGRFWEVTLLFKRAIVIILLIYVSCTSHSGITDKEIDLFYTIQGTGSAEFQYEETCSVHHFPTKQCSVPGFGGYAVQPPDDYIRARNRLFPNSYLFFDTGLCEQPGIVPVIRWVCAKCREAELAWMQSHGMRIPPEVLSAEWKCPCPCGKRA